MAFDWDDLRFLLELERGGSISAAARSLDVNHSTVSRRLAALEAGLGVRLVTRSAEGLVWTEAGERALESARSVERVSLALERDVASAAGALRGPVRVSVPAGMTPFLVGALEPFRARHPDLRVEITAANDRVDLRRRAADVAVRMSRPTQPDLVVRRALVVGWGVYASESYAARRGLPRSTAELRDHDLVRYAPGLSQVPGARWLEEHAGSGPAALRVDSTEAALMAVERGLGIGVVPCYLARGQPHLRRVLPAVVAESTGFVVLHEDARGVRRFHAVAEALVATFAEHAAVLRGEA